MARQRRPPVPTAERAQTTATDTVGETLHVDAEAAAAFQGAIRRPGSGADIAGAGRMSVRQTRDAIGRDGIRQAAVDAGHRPPSDRTLRRWAQQDRIPHRDIAVRVHRRGQVHQLGGTEQVEQITGRSRSAVTRWQSGQTSSFRGPAADALQQAQRADALRRAKVTDPDTGQVRRASGVVHGGVRLRHGDNPDYDYHDNARAEFDLDPADSAALADALAREDHAGALLILERNVSDDWFNYGDGFSDTDGWHFDDVSQLSVDWR